MTCSCLISLYGTLACELCVYCVCVGICESPLQTWLQYMYILQVGNVKLDHSPTL